MTAGFSYFSAKRQQIVSFRNQQMSHKGQKCGGLGSIDGVFSDMRIEGKGKSLRESQTSGQSLFCDRDQPKVRSETNTACEIFIH